MDTTTVNEFLAEQKAIHIIFICTGAISCMLSFLFFKVIKYSLFKGLAVTLLLLGICEAANGTVAVCHSGNIINFAEKTKQENSQFIKTQIQKTKQQLFMIEICLFIFGIFLALGTVLFIKFYNSVQVFWKGFGLGLSIQSTVSIILLFVQLYNFKAYYNYIV